MLFLLEPNGSELISCHWKCIVNKVGFSFYIESSAMCWQGNVVTSSYLVYPNTTKCIMLRDNYILRFTLSNVAITYVHMFDDWDDKDSNVECSGKNWPPSCGNAPYNNTGHVDGIL